MLRLASSFAHVVGLAACLVAANTAQAQIVGGNNSTGGQATNSSPGYSLSSRFQSNFSQFTAGSSAAGQTTAGAGAASAGVYGQSATGAMGQTGRLGGLSGIGGLGGYAMGRNSMGNNMMGGNTQQSNANQKIRTHMRLGFTAPAVNSARVSTSVTKLLNRILTKRSPAAPKVTVKMQERIAVLTGIVETDYDRDLVGRLAMLEPGIEAVRNELTVGPRAPKPSSSPTPSGVDPRQ